MNIGKFLFKTYSIVFVFFTNCVLAHHLNPKTAEEKSLIVFKIIESERPSFANQAFLDYLTRTVLHFDSNFCFGSNSDLGAQKCRALLNQNAILADAAVKYLDSLPQNRSKVKTLIEIFANEIGGSMVRLGWSDSETVSRSDFLNNTHYVSTNSQSLCIDLQSRNSPESLEILLPDGVSKIPLVEALPKFSRGKRVKPASVSLSNAIVIRVVSQVEACGYECVNRVQEEIVRAVSIWKEAAVGLDRQGFSIIDFGDRLFFNRSSFSKTKPNDPIPSRFSYIYEATSKDDLCRMLYKSENKELATYCNKENSKYLDVFISESRACEEDKNKIACADTKKMYLNARDYKFFGRDEFDYIFGNPKGEFVNLSTILTHEVGHWFSLPHLIGLQAFSEQRNTNMMSPIYSPNACIEINNIRVLGESLKGGWPYSQNSCLGLTYSKKLIH